MTTTKLSGADGLVLAADVDGPRGRPDDRAAARRRPDPPLVGRHLAAARRGRLAGVVGRPARPRRQRMGRRRRLLARRVRGRRAGASPVARRSRPCWSARRSAASSSLAAIGERPTQTDVARALVLVDVAHRIEDERADAHRRVHGAGTSTASPPSTRSPTRSRPTTRTDPGRRIFAAWPRTCASAPTAAGTGTGIRRSSRASSGRPTRPASSLVDPDRLERGGRHAGDPRPCSCGAGQRPAQRGGRAGLPRARPARRVRRRRRRRPHGRRRPQRALQPGDPRVPRAPPHLRSPRQPGLKDGPHGIR